MPYWITNGTVPVMSKPTPQEAWDWIDSQIEAWQAAAVNPPVYRVFYGTDEVSRVKLDNGATITERTVSHVQGMDNQRI